MHMLNAAIRGAQSIATSAYNTVTTAHLPTLRVKEGRLRVAGSKNEILAKGIALAGQVKLLPGVMEGVFTLSNGMKVNKGSLEGFLGVTSIGNKTAAQVDQMIQNRIAQLATIGDKAHTVTKKVAIVAVPVMAIAGAFHFFGANETVSGPTCENQPFYVNTSQLDPECHQADFEEKNNLLKVLISNVVFAALVVSAGLALDKEPTAAPAEPTAEPTAAPAEPTAEPTAAPAAAPAATTKEPIVAEDGTYMKGGEMYADL